MKRKAFLLIPALMLGITACDVSTIQSILSNLDLSSTEAPVSENEGSKESEGEPTSQESGAPTSSNPSSEEGPATSSSTGKPEVKLKEHPWITEEDGEIEIKWDNTFSYTAAIDSLIEDFKKIEPNIKVTSNKKSGGYDVLESDSITGFSANNYANIVTCYPDHVANYIDYGKAVNFDKYLYGEYGYTEDELDDFVENFIDEGRCFFDEGTWVMPHAKSTEPMYYNADILGKVIPGINGGKAIDENYISHLTWEELFDNFAPKFIEWNKTNKLIKLDPSEWGDNKFGGIIGYDSDDNFFITMCEQLGIPYTSFDMSTGYGSADFNNPEAKAMVKRMKEAYDKGYIFTKGTSNNNYTNYAFTAGQCLFTVGSTGGLKYQVTDAFETKVTFVPQSKQGVKDAMISQGPGVCILTHGNEKEDLAAWAFIKFLNEPENTLYWASETGYAPTRYSVYDMSEYLELCATTTGSNEEKLKAKVLSLYNDCKDYLFVNSAFKGSSAVRKQVGGLMTNALLDQDGHFTKGDYDKWLDELFNTAYNAALKEMF